MGFGDGQRRHSVHGEYASAGQPTAALYLQTPLDRPLCRPHWQLRTVGLRRWRQDSILMPRLGRLLWWCRRHVRPTGHYEPRGNYGYPHGYIPAVLDSETDV